MPPNNLDDFYLRAKQIAKHRNAKLIVIDYLQLLRSSGKYQQTNKVAEITDISRSLKMLAKEVNVPIIALSQLNRSAESREDKRPQLSDLRDSGSIEQDADIVMFIYRESYYASREEPPRNNREEEHKYQARLNEWQLYKEKIANEADIIIAKHRHGATTEVKLCFNSKLTKFSNHDKIKYSAVSY
jgi:replicative DNA helicase